MSVRKRRFFNMYLTTTVSVALVLFLIGLECILVLSAHQMIQGIKEKVALTVVLRPDADTASVTRLGSMLAVVPYTKEAVYISKEQALEEHIAHLGEDPTKFLGFNPLSNSYEVYLHADYACQDSIAKIERRLSSLPYVSQVIYQQDVVKLIDSNVNEISMILMAVALILLLMAVALIVNTVRLHIYSKRFIINTMRLVGATPWVIRAPFIRRNVLMGFEAAVLAIVALACAFYYCYYKLGIMLFELTAPNIAFVVVAVLVVGELITFLASLFAADRYIRMKIDRMYEI